MDFERVWKLVEAEFYFPMAFAVVGVEGEPAEMCCDLMSHWSHVLRWVQRGIPADVVAAAEAVAAGQVASFRVEGQEAGSFYYFAWIQASDSDGEACKRLDRFKTFARPDSSGCTGCLEGCFHDNTQPLPSPEEVLVYYFADCGVVVEAWVGATPPDTSS